MFSSSFREGRFKNPKKMNALLARAAINPIYGIPTHYWDNTHPLLEQYPPITGTVPTHYWDSTHPLLEHDIPHAFINHYHKRKYNSNNIHPTVWLCSEIFLLLMNVGNQNVARAGITIVDKCLHLLRFCKLKIKSHLTTVCHTPTNYC